MLDDKDSIPVDIDEETTLVDLFAKVLLHGTQLLLKRGVNKEYIEIQEDILGIKGKVIFGETVKANLLHRQRVMCEFDDYSHDILINQIIYTTINNLIHTENLDSDIKHRLSSLMYKFPNITLLKLTESHFKSIAMNRNTRFYRLLLNICKMIYEQLLPIEKKGAYTFKSFDEKRMNMVFETFLHNFYKIEQCTYGVSRRKIKWRMTSNDPSFDTYIPEMKTDITLDCKDNKIIIDAKYYQETMATNYKNQKIVTGNLYQLFSYLINQEDGTEKTKRTTGILLYPKIDKDYDLSYSFEGHTIRIITIDLCLNPSLIKENLLNIIS